MKYQIYEVGGKVRDEFLGVDSNDIDYSIIVDSMLWHLDINVIYNKMIQELEDKGYTIYTKTPNMFCFKAKFPKGHTHENTTADFVLARRESGYIKGTRTPNVTLGSLHDDLIRRDFTVNCIAKDLDNNYIDPFNGQQDIINKIIRTPMDASISFNNDPLRVIRALRFYVTKRFSFSDNVIEAIKLFDIELLDIISKEQISEELYKMFHFDTNLTLKLLLWLNTINPGLTEKIFNDGLWLMPTLKRK